MSMEPFTPSLAKIFQQEKYNQVQYFSQLLTMPRKCFESKAAWKKIERLIYSFKKRQTIQKSFCSKANKKR